MPKQAEPYFTLELDGQEIQRFSLDRARTSIGRARESEIQIAVRGVSRMHAVIIRDEDAQCVVRDLGSANGTYVNGVRISGEQTLDVGDVINFLDYALCFRRVGDDVAATSELAQVQVAAALAKHPAEVSALLTFSPDDLPDESMPTVDSPIPVLNAQPAAYEIEVKDESLGDQIYPVDKPVLTVGGEAASDVHVAGHRIERVHSLLVLVEGRLVFVRLSPVNISRVNGTARLVCHLEPNDEITIGNSTIIVRAK